MLAGTHVIIGLLVGTLLGNSEAYDLVFFSLVVVGSVLPDIDHHGSLINRLFPVTSFVPLFFRHRGFFHSIFPVLVLLVLSVGFSNYVVPLVLGYAAHLVSDSLTKMGVNFFYPLSNFKVKGPVTTGSLVEFVLMIVCLILLFSVYMIS